MGEDGYQVVADELVVQELAEGGDGPSVGPVGVARLQEELNDLAVGAVRAWRQGVGAWGRKAVICLLCGRG